MTGGPAMSVLFAAEALVPPLGGAERFALEALADLATRHDVRAAWIDEGSSRHDVAPEIEPIAVRGPARAGGYWSQKVARAGALGSAVADALAVRPADVVMTQLHGAPAVAGAARAAGMPVVVAVPSYEALCKYAFDAETRCAPGARCRGCPALAELDAGERAAHRACRRGQEAALAQATVLVAPSRAAAAAVTAWTGRRAEVLASVSAWPRSAGRADRAAPVVLAAARWSPNKGVRLLDGLCRVLAPRAVRITEAGLDDGTRARLGSMRHVTILPNPDGLALEDAGLLLMPSQWEEPFGRVAFEGMAAGVPTLASAAGGLREFVPAQQLVDPPDSLAAWGTAIRALEDPEAWRAARRAGLEAAAAVLETRPLERLEAVLRSAAATQASA